MKPGRREFLYSGGLALGGMAVGCGVREPASALVDDVSGLNPVVVDSILRPTRTSEIQVALTRTRGTVSIGGGRYSMGGQIASEHSLHIDMRSMRRLLWLDHEAGVVRVQSGMSWRALQDAIDPHGLSVKVMQSYSNFTVGGSVSVNCHGRYVGKGPIAGTVRALQLVTASGEVRELSTLREADLFGAVLGGYGGLGVVTEVELDLDPNDRIGRRADRISLDEYPSFFLERVLADPEVVLHNADLMPPQFDAPLSIDWRRTDAPLTQTRRLVPRDLDYSREQTLIWSATELPGHELVRDRFLTEKLMREPAVTWRNHEASLDVRSLEPRTRLVSTYLLQEYFVPVEAFASFTRQMRRILIASQANILNVSIRHSPADTRSLLRWAETDVFSFVVYHKQRSWAGADAETERWTQRLVAAALDHGGRYYLPYRLHATPMQFRRAYPEHIAFARIRDAIDPQNRFRNRLWDKYLST
ncbi:FAD-binding oxidoreductase [Lysobacter sp. M15]|uniref:FAD-binding oxidoreductase n=1 Tax=Lysobacter sp. M15 TaxID=2916837 RepID=UPI001F575F29|nr:FAD-binding oxidoreductase [Lysobacter sp. M15]